MPPLRLAAIGLLLVLVTINLGSFTLSLDLLGWLMVVGGMHQLAEVNKWFGWARNLAVVALVLELVLMISPFAIINVLASPLNRLAVLAFVFCLCTALLQQLGRSDRGYAVTLQVLRVLIPLVTVAAAVFAAIEAPAGLPMGWLYPVQLIGTAVLAGVMWLLGARYSFTR
ncbi:MAG: hypothetical protein IPL41_09035 [Micropruina sp.]|nr:hypothetical protein [Micropruina sp.]